MQITQNVLTITRKKTMKKNFFQSSLYRSFFSVCCDYRFIQTHRKVVNQTQNTTIVFKNLKKKRKKEEEKISIKKFLKFVLISYNKNFKFL